MVLDAVRHGLRSALDVVTPVTCAGCGRAEQVVCADCAAELYAPPRRADAPLVSDVETWAATAYTGSTRELVLAWKRGRADVRPVVHDAVGQLADRWAALLPAGSPLVSATLGVVPAPSGWVRRARGLLVVAALADAVAVRLAEALPDARPEVADVLRRRGVGHLAGLGAAARAASRTAESLRVRELPVVDAWVLVDDVVTSGATLRASARALEGASGRPVVAALALAATPRRSGARGPRM